MLLDKMPLINGHFVYFFEGLWKFHVVDFHFGTYFAVSPFGYASRYPRAYATWSSELALIDGSVWLIVMPD